MKPPREEKIRTPQKKNYTVQIKFFEEKGQQKNYVLYIDDGLSDQDQFPVFTPTARDLIKSIKALQQHYRKESKQEVPWELTLPV
jgi:hypothetical protein